MAVQAVDDIMKCWLRATIVDIAFEEEKLFLRRSGFGKEFDNWIPISKARMSVDDRILLPRNAISSSDYPIRNHPKNLQHGDDVVDFSRNNKEFVVDINDPFKSEVN